MYALENIALHNWYHVDAQDVSVHGVTGIIGKTGTGKSSLLDAIKTVVTGNHKLRLGLNSSAGENKKRTVREYVLGCDYDVNEGRPARDRCEATLALSFRDDATGQVVSIGVLLAADRDVTNEESRCFVADGLAFRIADFIELDEDGAEVVVDHAVMIERMRAQLGTKKFEVFQNKKRYVEDYLQRMRRYGAPEGERFLRSFHNTADAKSIKNPTDFVRNLVLEPLPVDIQSVRERILDWRGLDEEVRRLEAQLHEIRNVKDRFGRAFRRQVEEDTDAFLLNHLLRLDYECEAAENEERAATARGKAHEAEIAYQRYEAETQTLVEELAQLKADRANSESAARLSIIKAHEQTVDDRRRGSLKALGDGIRLYAEASNLRIVDRYLPISTQEAVRAASTLQETIKGRSPADWLADGGQVLTLARQTKVVCTATAAIKANLNSNAEEISEGVQRERYLTEQLRGAEKTGNFLSPATIGFMHELSRQGIESVPLPEVVDVSDPEWAFALESLLGPNREALIIDPDDVGRAFTLLHRNRNQFYGCRIVDTRKTRKHKSRAKSGSIAEIAVSDNEDALAFIDYNVGRYIRVETGGDLDAHDFAILKDGRTNAGYAKRVFRDQTTILGKAARASAVEKARAEYGALKKELDQKRQIQSFLTSALAYIEKLQAADPAELEELIQAIRNADAEMSSLARQRAAVETDDDRELDARIRETEALIDEAKELRDEARGDQKKAAEQATKADAHAEVCRSKASDCLGAEEQLAERQTAPEDRRVIELLGLENASIAAARERIRNQVEMKPDFRSDRRRFYAAEIAAVRERQSERAHGEKLPALRHRAADALNQFCNKWFTTSPIEPGADFNGRFDWVLKRERIIERNELRPHKEELVEARKQMETALKENLLSKLGENFARMDGQIRDLNGSLAKHTFVGQRYLFTRSVNLAMKPLYDLVQKLSNSPERGLFGFEADGEQATDEDVRKGMAVFERLVTEEQNTVRYDDYREYFEFELNFLSEGGKPVPFSKFAGKLSGGQDQAPYYVAIAASMASTYYPSSRLGIGEGMGLVLFDEAFNKLDVANTQNLVALFGTLGLQIVVAVPEEKRASLIECVDSVINVSRRPHSADVFIETVRIGDQARDAMMRENPEHLGIEAYRRVAAAAE